ncbi:hypothetical protein J2X73_003675 [Novosphingobium sp. 1748]|uniref:hypothetical protein n=1 Tax=Novosphingobium sp. 1748 TaxID=2817760 RepID=UPI00285B1DB4|nr:hypothetical protein [Novosphingobium sp. 1748]MDR6709286.1 hypothetical protein [Novosphingobium sp. 1748]
MNGILSATPAPRPIRLLVGSQGLLLMQSLIAWHLPAVPGLFRMLVAVTGLVALAALVTAIAGEKPGADERWWRRRHAR